MRIKLTVEEDYDIGHCIRTAVIPESVLWFTGEHSFIVYHVEV